MAAGSVAGGSVVMGSPEGAVAAPPQEEMSNPKIRTNMILGIIQTHFRASATDCASKQSHKDLYYYTPRLRGSVADILLSHPRGTAG